MNNCRPAGLSSDEDGSDDGFEFFLEPKTKQRNYQNNYFNQPLNLSPEEELFDAVTSNNSSKVYELISKGVNLNSLQAGWTPLMFSCFHGLPETTKLLLENGSDINFHKDFFTPLMAVCTNSVLGSAEQKAECVDLLLARGIDINATDRYRTSALMLAAREGLQQIVRLLIEKSCEINKQDKDGWSALFHAVYSNRIEVVDILVASGANWKLKDLQGRTPYELALSKGYDDIAAKIKIEKICNDDDQTLFNVAPILTIKQMLNELPSRNIGKNPGFPSDIYNLLHGMSLQMYAKCLYKNNMQLGEFLVINSDQLKEYNVKFFIHRQKILNSLKRFHLFRWQKSSIGLKPKNETIGLLDGIKLLGTTVRQIYVMQSSLHYIQLNKLEVNSTDELKRIINNSLNIIELINKELSILNKFGKHIDKVKKVRPVDLLVKEEKSEKPTKLLKISIVCAVGIIFLSKTRYFFDLSFLKNPLKL